MAKAGVCKLTSVNGMGAETTAAAAGALAA